MQSKNTENGDALNCVYLPFIKKECSEEIVQEVRQCAENAHHKEVGKRTYKFIAYGKKELSSLPPNSSIYIIGYISVKKDEKFLSGGCQAISIETIVERMIRDGLLDADLLKIKLWYSDYNDNAVVMAEKFLECLKKRDAKNRFLIDCYPGNMLCFPLLQENEKHKWAVNLETEARNRASQVKFSLFFNTESVKLADKSDVNAEPPVPQDLWKKISPF